LNKKEICFFSHRKTFYFCLFTFFLFPFSGSPLVNAQQSEVIQWGLGLRGGMGVFTQDILQGSSQGALGPTLSGEAMVIINNFLTAGFNVEWEIHQVDRGGMDRGEATTISLMPFYEIRVPNLGDFSPYQVLGAGINLNSFDEDQAFCVANYGSTCKFGPVNTVALKVGGGFDYFITPFLAFNTEIGWKFNSGQASVQAGGMTVAIEDYDANVFSVLFGVRQYF
jgi:hypothetical protein